MIGKVNFQYPGSVICNYFPRDCVIQHGYPGTVERREKWGGLKKSGVGLTVQKEALLVVYY